MRAFRRHGRARWLATSALALPAAAILLTACPAAAQILPSGGQVTVGAATIESGAAGVTVHQGGDRAVIEWQSFSVGAGTTVTFDQPNAAAAILNRVTGAEMSRIDGLLQSNGQVFLLNRNGLIIGKTGVVDTRGGFVGSTLDMKDEDFMAGRYRFGGIGGAILNQGRILTGPAAAIALIGGRVANEGLISAPLGKVALGSGLSATLDLSGDGFLQVALPASLTDGPLLANTGRIEADGGLVVMRAATAREAVRRVVNMSGVIAARSVSGGEGVVVLDGGEGGTTAVSGTVDVSGDKAGGRVDILGGEISLTGAQILAGGGDRGGQVRVGGAFQGGRADPDPQIAPRFGVGPALSAATRTTFDADSLIDVSGGQAGGSAVLWSDVETVQHGAIRANGGGAVEISSKGRIDTALGRVETGPGGLLLLDPKNIVVDNPAFQGGATMTGYTGPVAFADAAASGDTTYISALEIETILESGTNVVLQASNDLTLANLGVSVADLTVGDLILRAGRNVFISDVTLGNANMLAVANDSTANGVVAADRDPGVGQITVGGPLSAGAGSGGVGGDVTLRIGDGVNPGSIRISTSLEVRNLTMDAGAGLIEVRNFVGDQIAIAADDNITMSGGIKVDADSVAFSGDAINWTNEATALLAGRDGAPITFTEDGVLTRVGVLGRLGGDGQPPVNNTRLALGGDGAAPQYSANVGQAYPAFAALHVVSGSLNSGDILANLLASGSVNIAGPAAGASPGLHDVNVSATGTFALASGKRGYFIDLRAVTDVLNIGGLVLIPTITAGNYTYGSPTAVVTLGGLQSGDQVSLTASLSSGGTATLSQVSGGGYAFSAGLSAGSRTFTLTGLSGADAGDYTLDLSGIITAALTITPRPLTYQVNAASSTYGTLATRTVALTGVLGFDDVSAGAITVVRDGVSSSLAANTAAGTYVMNLASLTGGAAGNYSIAASGNTTADLVIARKAITYVTANASSTYGALAVLADPTLTGVLGGDTVTATAQTPTTLTTTTGAGTYDITAALSGVSAGNYVVSATGNTTGVLTIAPKALTFAVASGSQVYGSPTALITLNGILAGDTVLPAITEGGSGVSALAVTSSTFGVAAQAGSHTYNLFGLLGTQAGNYSLDLGSGTTSSTLTVTRKPITYSIDTTTSTYGVAAAAPILSFTGLVGSDNVTAPVVATRQSDSTVVSLGANTGAGSYALTVAPGSLTGFQAANYTLAATGNTPGLRVIDPRNLTFTLGTSSSTYGTLATLGAPTLVGVINGDQVSGSIAVALGATPITLTDRTPAGSYDLNLVSLTGSGAGNYTFAPGAGGVLTIAPKVVTYALGASTSTYGALATPSLTLNGILSGDDIGGVLARGGGAVDALTPAGTYTVFLSGLNGAQGGNYQLATSGNINGSLTVSRRTLTYSVAGSGSTYGDSLAYGAVTFNGVVAGDTVTAGSVSLLGVSSATPDVGSYAQVATLSDVSALNYVLASSGNINGAYTITPRLVTIHLVSNIYEQSAMYGVLRPGDVFALATVNGLVAGDGVTGTAPALVLPTSTGGFIQAGTYAIAATASLTGAKAGNYTVSSVTGGAFTVTPKALSTFGSPAFTTTYGTTTIPTASVLPTVAAGDVIALSGLTVGLNGATISVGSNTPVGSYTLSATGVSGADAANYTFAGGVLGSLVVNPKELTYAVGSSTSVYGDTPAGGAATLTGVVGSDQVSAVTGLAGGSGAATHAGTYTTVVTGLTGAAAGNYTLSVLGNTNGVLTITPRPLTYTVTSTDISWVYGDPTTSPIQLQGVLAGDQVRVQLAAINGGPRAYFLDQGGFIPAGSYKLVVEGGLIGGLGDYTLAYNSSLPIANLTIAPRPVTYSLTLSSDWAIYGSPAGVAVSFGNLPTGASLAYTLLSSGKSGDLGAVLPVNLPAGAHILTLRPIGDDAGNYLLSPTGAAPTLTIRPKPIQITLDSATATYGTAFGDFVSIAGLLAGDEVAPIARFETDAVTLKATGAGFGFDLLTEHAGPHTVTITELTGAAAGNYEVVDFKTVLTVAPKTITYSTGPITVQYGGLTACDDPSCASTARELADLSLGVISWTGVLSQDLGLLQGAVQLSGASGLVTYARNTPAGTYGQVVTGLTGSAANDYVLARDGNTVGLATIQPAWVAATVTGGGRIYNGSLTGGYQTVGSPGEVTIMRTLAGQGGAPLTGFLAGDDVDVQVGVYQFLGGSWRPLTGDGPIPVGAYELRPFTLTGNSAANYRLLPIDARGGGSLGGAYQVSDASIFNFAFLSSNANAVYTPPAAVTAQSLQKISLATGTSTTSSVDQGAASFTARGAAGAGASATVDLGEEASMSGLASAAASGMAQFGLTGVYAGGSAAASAKVSLDTGPVSASLNATTSTGGDFIIDPDLVTFKPSIMLDAMAKSSAGNQVVVDGEIADGVSGGLSGQSEIFVEARTDTQIMWDVQQGKSNVGTSQFIGVGGSMGITGDLSYGGVSAGATVTVFSPGSLYIGARSVSDVKDGVFTLNMTIGISIGIGGLELRPSIAFPVAPLAPVGDAANFILSGGKTTGSPEERAAQAATQRFDTAAGLLSKSGGATLDLMSYLQANPDVLDRAKSATDPTSQKLALAYDNYGSLPNQLSDVLAKEKALATRINADPAHITPADLALAADLRTQERIMIGKVANLGGKIEVVDGQITLAAR